jgi:hypothetical protein
MHHRILRDDKQLARAGAKSQLFPICGDALPSGQQVLLFRNVEIESMQSCGVFKQRQQAGVGLRVGESPGANGEMHLPEWR